MEPCPTHSPDSAQLLCLSAELVPALQGRLGTPGGDELLPGANLGPVTALLAQLAHQHPEAGGHYWTLRCWALVTWQPVMLSLLAAQRLGCVLELTRVGQHCHAGMVAGYTLGEGALRPATMPVIPAAAAALRRGCETLLAGLAARSRLNHRLAWRLLADRVLATLLRIHPDGGPRLVQLGQQWLTAMELTGASDLMAVPLPDGSERLALDRKGCCQHFRRHDGELCATCPRLSRPERIQRLQQETLNHAGTA